ncbi:Ig-like domain-containing protein [Patescibacteria group bacterium]|nr:Ig-like domain-containing protein [Patescibacteria group bacterium]MBU1868420.1 Ig-like domain-containing protein [Patescibacteria group bacterium]
MLEIANLLFILSIILLVIFVALQRLGERWRGGDLWVLGPQRMYALRLALWFGLLVSGSCIFVLPPRISDVLPADQSVVAGSQSRLRVVFDRWVRERDIAISVTPEISGSWQALGAFRSVNLAKEFVLNLERSLSADTTYYIKVSNLRGVIGLSGIDYEFAFQTLSPPKVVAVIPSDGQEDVLLDTQIEVLLDNPNLDVVEWEFEFKPRVEFSLSKLPDEGYFIIGPSLLLDQETQYVLSIFQAPVVYEMSAGTVASRGERVKVYEGSFTTILAPRVSRASPTGEQVLPNEVLEVSFSKTMDYESVENKLEVLPAIAGDFSWKDEKTLVFTPEQWEKDTRYTVTIPVGVKDAQGGFFEKEEVLRFKTLGDVKVEEFFPVNGAGVVDIDTYISVKFNQLVDQSSAQEEFSLNPAVSGQFMWKGNVMTFVPNNVLVYNRQYQIKIESGVESKYGLNSKQDFVSQFTTRQYQVKLRVPLLHQEHSHTCNITAARMALAFRGTWLTEQQVLQKVGFDNTPYQPGIGIWGDPNEHYVGSINGQPKGYGVHWGPVARVIREYREVEVYRNWNLPGLLGKVEQGNPVILWWQNGWNDPDPISWHTPDGALIQGVEGMHSEVVIGFVGNKDNPDEIILNDPWRGERHYTQSHFLNLWKYYNNTGVVVY